MAGLGLALVGGALRGFGEGQLASIKAMREEKLKQLDYEHAEKLQGSQQTFLAGEGAANRASQERMTKAQQENTLAVTKLGITGQKDITGMNIAAQKDLSKDELQQRRDQIAAQIASGEKIAGEQIGAQKDIAKMQIDAASALDTKFVTQADGSSVMMQGGKVVPMPNDPKTGKPMNPAITDSDTPEMKNIKYLMTYGMSFERAQDVILGAKNADKKLANVSLFNAMVNGASTMKNLSEQDLQSIWKQSQTFSESLYPGTPAAPAAGETPAPGSPSSAADPGTTAPAPDAAAAAIKFPEGTTPEQAVAWAKAQLERGKSRNAIKETLKANNVEPSLAGL